MKRLFALIAVLCLLLSGCASMFDGSYVSTMPHLGQDSISGGSDLQVSDFDGLLNALIGLAERGSRSGIIYVPNYDQDSVGTDMERAAKTALRKSPIAAYAVEEITWELGTNSGQRAVAVSITYYHERAEILKIQKVSNTQEAIEVLYKELDDSSAGVVMYLEDYDKADYVQIAEEYAFNNPQAVMEMPQVIANVYPKTGVSRVVELKFTYQNSREALRLMKSQVSPVYISSKYNVTAEEQDRIKFMQLYSFLMERGFGEYTIATSNTPAYSLLLQGTGDSKAFATMFAAICRQSDLECKVITGTKNAEAWYWNLVKVEDSYYHLDLLRSHGEGEFQLMLDEQMTGYVWDYSAFPATPEAEEPSDPETEPSDPETEPTPTQTEPEQTQPTE